jgi:hypothetical protein
MSAFLPTVYIPISLVLCIGFMHWSKFLHYLIFCPIDLSPLKLKFVEVVSKNSVPVSEDTQHLRDRDQSVNTV